jgi:hypothetical protein
MNDLQASEQASRLQPEPYTAFERNPNPVIYDLSGARAYILRDEKAKDMNDVVSMDFLKTRRDYVTLVKDDEGNVLYRIEGDETLAFQCQACQKNFTTKQSLERHHYRFPLCKNWKEESEPVLSESVYMWAQKKIDGALSIVDNYKTCRFCEKEFSSVGNFHKHFESATVCNRLGMREIKKTFTTN